jgi:uncharacterized membrane protein YbhN (UPF0104 family)
MHRTELRVDWRRGVLLILLALLTIWIFSRQSAAVVLTFRAAMFWLPLLIGFFALRRVRAVRSPEEPEYS